MSCDTFKIGDTGIPITINASACSGGALGSAIVSGTFTFTGPEGTTFDRPATVPTATQVRYVIGSGDYGDGAFDTPGTWRVTVAVVLADDSERSSLDCASFTIRA